MKQLLGVIVWLISLPVGIFAFLTGTSKTQFAAIFFLAGFVWVPLAQVQAIADPVGTYINLARVGVGAYNMKKDVEKVMPPAVKYSAQKAKRYQLDAWAKNVALANGTYRPAFHTRIGHALMSPFRFIGSFIR